jgi:membrane-bound lytic murein transglycosylase D
MQFRCLFIFLALLALAVRAQQPEMELDLGEVVDAAQEWAAENLDEEVLQALPEVDRKQVEDFLKAFAAQLRGSNVVDLAQFKDAAKLVLPLLDRYEETTPLAAWLRSRLDYFEVAEEFEKSMPPSRGQPLTNPPPAVERTVWVKKLSQTDWPKGAKELVPAIKPIFAAEKVPPELVWLAEVESSFNPKARSPVGAAGLFQLMPATAKRFGLRSWPWDQRYQPEPSARAAAQYLNLLGRQFGDWRLALAAYNAGEGRVQRLLAKHNAKSFDGIATHLPAETQMFVPKVEATVLRREGREIPRYARTQIPKQTN